MESELFRTREGTEDPCEDCVKIRPRRPRMGPRLVLVDLYEAESDPRLGQDVARYVARRLDLAAQV